MIKAPPLDDLVNTALAALVCTLALTACERAPAQASAPFLTCNSDRSGCASSTLEITP
ncbi:hypothetical protein [Paracoccus tibetensis]|uniref:Lipoprotein n=1 Tax=Paracoccus tibetensis TaxID=336292 RepID=A0A1G5BGA5_9RHOB|nr:hypothetical protein [Paracoccus tibetensis]SCX89094.1 hypothetical protein SAMN05660710_00132 [Paracoccus tibetensis]